MDLESPTRRWLDKLRFLLITLALAAVACQQPPVAAERGQGDEKHGSAAAAAAGPARPEEKTATEPPQEVEEAVEQLTVEIVATYPHDPTAFTQGLLWDGGVLYESTGLYGRSTVRRVDPADGRILDRTFLDPNFFGEGLALVEGRLIQLTWKAGIALVYELGRLELVDQYGYNGEGWGLACDGERLVMSNGSEFLTFRNLGDFQWLSTLEVRLEGRPVSRLNELEFAEGDLYANVWGENHILRIDPQSGRVEAEIDASSLLSAQEARIVDVLNGIAYDPLSKTFWLTGKFWPKIFQVRFVPKG